MKKIFTLFLLLWQVSMVHAQNTFTANITDAESKETLIGVTVVVKNTRLGAISDANGNAMIRNIPNGRQILAFSYVGYMSQELELSFPLAESKTMQIALQPEEESDEIIVETTRANRSISAIPTRIEVLTDEIDEASNMEPSRISHLITHTTGVQVQTTSATSNGSVVRIQGMNGRYSKMLKDGFPLYGGFSGSLDVLQIAPLDLRQIEIIKGPSSTIHGGGAIAGVLNLISKTPQKDEVLLHLNRSTIGSNDLNAFVARKFGKFGFTNLMSYQLHDAFDADEDGYSDMPKLSKFNVNPKLFYYPDAQTVAYFGGTISREFREGGDMKLLNRAAISAQNFYSDHQESSRYSTQFKFDRKLGDTRSITFKNSINQFDRYLNIRQAANGASAIFGGVQNASFSEFAYQLGKSKHDLLFGANYTTEDFSRKNYGEADFTTIEEEHRTASAFMNHIWSATNRFNLESGLRVDHNQNESNMSKDGGKVFVMPRVSGLIKYSPTLTSRIGAGLGYRPFTIFNEEAEPFGFKNFVAIDFANVNAEKSLGINADFTYNAILNEKTLITLNQMFFFNQIDNPIALQSFGNGKYRFVNGTNAIQTRGFETHLKVTLGKITWFMGYTYNDAYFDNADKELLVLNPKHSVKGDFLFAEEGKWRIGVDYEYKSAQKLSDGNLTRDLFTTGVVIERTLGNFVLFFNAENVTDVRQTKYESILTAPYKTPQFTEIWAPLDGRFFNFGFKIKVE